MNPEELKTGDVFEYVGSFARYYVFELRVGLVLAANMDSEYPRAIAINPPEEVTLLHRGRPNTFGTRVQAELEQLQEERR